jgi:hypothetical protein
MNERIRVTLNDQGQINWTKGGSGIPVKEFVKTYPCKSLHYLAADGGVYTKLGQAILSTIGGSGNLIEFNRQNLCGEADNLLQQI